MKRACLRGPHAQDHRGVDLISDVLPFGRLWYGQPNAIANAIGYAKHRGRSDDAVIRVYDEAGNLIETHEHAGEFKEPQPCLRLPEPWLSFGIRCAFFESRLPGCRDTSHFFELSMSAGAAPSR
jgi:hypothetical protein